MLDLLRIGSFRVDALPSTNNHVIQACLGSTVVYSTFGRLSTNTGGQWYRAAVIAKVLDPKNLGANRLPNRARLTVSRLPLSGCAGT